MKYTLRFFSTLLGLVLVQAGTPALATDETPLICPVNIEQVCIHETCTVDPHTNLQIIIESRKVNHCHGVECEVIGISGQLEDTGKYRTYYYRPEGILKINMSTGAFVDIVLQEIFVHRSVGFCEGDRFDQ
ncbi:MAG: hypothetical protein ACPGOY_18820 [Rhodospirillaceae bacterium]